MAQPSEDSKVFNDPVHGHVEIHPLCVNIMDTPHFQRLRHLAQLGGVYQVFPGASHNRFEHSVGVCHLANVMLQQLKRCENHLEEDEKITDEDSLCVQIAGLCHDLGHGIWSHLFDLQFLPSVPEDQKPPGGWEHEHASAGMFRAALDADGGGLRAKFRAWGLGEAEEHFVQELIFGAPSETPEGFQWVGRGKRSYLYEIVANKRNGVDVDKFDYFARDCHHLGVPASFDALRLMCMARIYRVEGALHVCFPNKEAWNVYELFHTRYNLHKRAYQHKVANACELMVRDALLAANPHFRLRGAGGRPCTLAQSVADPEAYLQVDDSILRELERSSAPELAGARGILGRLRRRRLYKMTHELIIKPGVKNKDILTGSNATTFLTRAGAAGVLLRDEDGGGGGGGGAQEGGGRREFFGEGDFHVDAVRINYGKGARNPVQAVSFFSPKERGPDGLPLVGEMPADCVSWFIPQEFQETYLRLYIKTLSKSHVITKTFRKWCDSSGLRAESPLTPSKSKQVLPPKRGQALKRYQTDPGVDNAIMRSTRVKRKLPDSEKPDVKPLLAVKPDLFKSSNGACNEEDEEISLSQKTEVDDEETT